MNRLRQRQAGWACTLLVLAAGLSGGCRPPAGKIELTSYKDPYFPESYHVALDDCAYRVDAGGDMHIVGRAVTRGGEPEGPITQLLHAHVFWQPRPGVTFADATTTTAVLRYVITTSTGTAVYTGTGFVYPRRERRGRLAASIESGHLRLESQTGRAPELLGDSRLRGMLRTRHDPHAAVNLVRTLEYYAAGQIRP